MSEEYIEINNKLFYQDLEYWKYIEKIEQSIWHEEQSNKNTNHTDNDIENSENTCYEL
jgi:hypothetical protein